MNGKDRKSFNAETFKRNVGAILSSSQRRSLLEEKASDLFDELKRLRKATGGWFQFKTELVRKDGTSGPEDLLVDTNLKNTQPNNNIPWKIHEKTPNIVIVVSENAAGAISCVSNITAKDPETGEVFSAPIMGVNNIIAAVEKAAIDQEVLFPDEVGEDGRPHHPKLKPGQPLDIMKAFGRS